MVPKRQGDPAGAADGGQGEQLGRRNRVTVSLLHSPPLTQHHVIARDQIPGKPKRASVQCLQVHSQSQLGWLIVSPLSPQPSYQPPGLTPMLKTCQGLLSSDADLRAFTI